MAKTRRKPGKKLSPLGRKRLGDLLSQNQKALLKVLDKHGIVFCPGCFLTLFSPLERAAAYHAVPDVKKFLQDVQKSFKDR